MSEKKPYSQPQVFEVELNPEQAILSACTTPAVSAQAGGGPYCRPSNGCKRATSSSGSNSGARPS